MQKLKTFFKSAINSCIKPDYYNDIVKASFSFSWKYFAFLMLLVAIIPSIMTGVELSKFEPSEAVPPIMEMYPDELEITVNQEGVTINQELPYSIDFPSEYQQDAYQESVDVSSLVTFDSDENIRGINDFYDAKSYILITESTFYMFDDMNTKEVRVYPIDLGEDAEEFFITEEFIETGLNKFISHPFISNKLYVPTLAALVFVSIFIFYSLFKIISIAVNTVFVLVIKSIFFSKKKVSYAKIFQMHLHAITLFIVLEYLISKISSINYTGTMSFFLFLAWMTFLLSRLDEPKKKVSKTKKK